MIEKKVTFNHGISENGELQVQRVTTISDAGVILNTTTSELYSPADPKNMDGFDEKSKQIATIIYADGVKEELDKTKQHITGQGMEKTVTFDRTIGEDGIYVRQITRVFDDGVEVSKTYHRHNIYPENDIENEDYLTKLLAKHLLNKGG